MARHYIVFHRQKVELCPTNFGRRLGYYVLNEWLHVFLALKDMNGSVMQSNADILAINNAYFKIAETPINLWVHSVPGKSGSRYIAFSDGLKTSFTRYLLDFNPWLFTYWEIIVFTANGYI